VISKTTTSRREMMFAVLLIVLTTLLTYGTQISKLGYYRDDWYLLWTAESQGMQGLINLFRGDRPFVGWLYVFDFSMLGVSPFGWHLYALLIKVASALAFFWLVRSLWPNRKIETTFITLLFVVYPGFYQQPNALTFKQLLIAYTAALLSLALTVNVVKANSLRSKTLLTSLAILLGAFYVFIYEALIGTEVVRLLLLLYIFNKQKTDRKDSVRLAFRNAIPYLFFAGLFVFWRFFIFHSTRNATNSGLLAGNFTSLHGLLHLLVETGKDLFETSILAWGIPFYQFSYQITYTDFGMAFVLVFLVLLATVGYYSFVRKQIPTDSDRDVESSLDWLILGGIIIFVTTLPIVVAGRNVLFAIQWDRYTYQSVFGVALLAGGFVFYALRGNLRWVIFGLLLISGISTQVFSGMFYRDFWTAQRDAWWQLYWRAPQIAEGATVIASLPGGFQFAEEYEVWGPLNLIYHRGEPLIIAGQIPINHLEIDLERGTLEERLVRGTVTVKRDYNYAIVASAPSGDSCLHVYNRSLINISILEPSNIAAIAPYSQTDLIKIDASSPVAPTEIMGGEPTHDWCYYYQKINLALQAGHWADAAHLADDAQSADLNPKDATEWMSVLEAYANNGQDKKAKQTSTYINDKRTRLYICQQLKKVPDWPDGYRSDLILEYMCNVH
jgi:hypothetical protein